MIRDLKEIVKNFTFEGTFVEASPYGFGHINDTYAVVYKKSGEPVHRYILQRINHNIFKTPEKLMENIEAITNHLRNKVLSAGGDPCRETLNLIKTKAGESFYSSPEGEYWRAYIFIEGAKTYQIVEKPSHLYHAGKAFGKFQQLLSDFAAETLHETISDFHHTYKRFQAFQTALEKDVMNRAKAVQPEINFVLNRAADTSALVDLMEQGGLPLRVTHNDTKFNNVMIDDKTGEGICVIDLDTVMPGLALYDFGDSIRSGANPANEDEKDVSKVCMDLNLYENFTRGFLESTHGFLTAKEREFLPFSAKLMTLECGIRFLTDHLSGDVYFKIHHEGHNLDRARTQFKMVEDMEMKMDKMKQIVEKYS